MKKIRHLLQHNFQGHAGDFTTTRQNKVILYSMFEAMRSTLLGNNKTKDFVYTGLEVSVNGNDFDIAQGSMAMNVGEIWRLEKNQEDGGEEGTIYGNWIIKPLNYPDTLEFHFTSPSLTITDNNTGGSASFDYTIINGTWKSGIFKLSPTSSSGTFSWFSTSIDSNIYIDFDGSSIIIYSFSKHRPTETDYIFLPIEKKESIITWSGFTDTYNILQMKFMMEDGYEAPVSILDPNDPSSITLEARFNERQLSVIFSIKSDASSTPSVDHGYVKVAEFGVDPGSVLKDINDIENWDSPENTQLTFTLEDHRSAAVIDHPDGSIIEDKLNTSLKNKINSSSITERFHTVGVLKETENELGLIVDNGNSKFEILSGWYKSNLDTKGVISDSTIDIPFPDSAYVQIGTTGIPDVSDWENVVFSGAPSTEILACDGAISKIINGSVRVFDLTGAVEYTVVYDAPGGQIRINTASAQIINEQFGTVPASVRVQYQYYQVRKSIIQAGYDPSFNPIIEIKTGVIPTDTSTPVKPNPDIDFIEIWEITETENQISWIGIGTDVIDSRNWIIPQTDFIKAISTDGLEFLTKNETLGFKLNDDGSVTFSDNIIGKEIWAKDGIGLLLKDQNGNLGLEILDGGDSRFSQNVTIQGNLTVNGTVVTIDTETLQVEDNIIVCNYGESGAGVTNGSSGIKIDRGSLTDYMFVFDEARDGFVIGQGIDETAPTIASLQMVATRQDSLTNLSIPYWNDTLKRFDTEAAFTYNPSTNTLNVDNIIGVISSATIASTVTVTPLSTNVFYNILFHSGNSIYSDSVAPVGLQYNPSTNILNLAVLNLGSFSSSILSNNNNTKDIGTVGVKWKDGFFGGTVSASIFDASNHINTNDHFRVDGVQVVSNKQTGWTILTSEFDRIPIPGVMGTAQLSNILRALIYDLNQHGLIGT